MVKAARGGMRGPWPEGESFGHDNLAVRLPKSARWLMSCPFTGTTLLP
jgi:hypothetical protein